MRIARTGRLVPTAARGHVTGRHRHVINLRLSDTDGAYLVSLVTRRADWTELALELVDDGIAPEWSTLVAVDDGTAATITDGHVDLGSRRVALPARSAGTSVAATPPGPRPIESWSPEDVAALRRALLPFAETGFTGLVAGTGAGDGSSGDADPFRRRARTRLLEAARTGSRVPIDLSGMVGLGAGFTPAGDDFVSGAILAELVLPGPVAAGTVPRVDRDSIRRSLSRTTPGGASLLRVSLAGWPPAYQVAIVDDLRRGDLTGAVDRARRHGHSSGLDALAGFVWATDPYRFDRQRGRV